MKSRTTHPLFINLKPTTPSRSNISSRRGASYTTRSPQMISVLVCYTLANVHVKSTVQRMNSLKSWNWLILMCVFYFFVPWIRIKRFFFTKFVSFSASQEPLWLRLNLKSRFVLRILKQMSLFEFPLTRCTRCVERPHSPLPLYSKLAT